MKTSQRWLGTSGVNVGAFGLGCWPLAGMTREGVSREAAVATVAAAFECGIRHFDTAYFYGIEGESERAIAEALAGKARSSYVIASKCGTHWEPGRKQVWSSEPEQLRRETAASLQRLRTDQFDLLYLHGPDPARPIEEAAEVFAGFRASGITKAVGLSNVTVSQMERFSRICPVEACQMRYNMLMRDIEAEVIPWCQAHGTGVIVYWPLMKGLLSGSMTRDRTFPASDARHTFPMFRGEEYQRNLDFVEVVKREAMRLECSTADLVLAWTAERAGIASVLFGATSPEQVRANAQALSVTPDDAARAAIESAYQARSGHGGVPGHG